MKKLLALLAALAFAPGAHALYKCTDEKGKTHIADTPPPQCERVIMYEVTPSGTVKRTIEPTLTEEQKLAKAADAERAKEAARLADEQRRKDLALLATYSNEKDIEVSRDRNIEPVMNRIKGANERSAAVDKRIKELEDEMEFYKAGSKRQPGNIKPKEPPVQLVSDLERARKEKSQLAANLAGYDKDIESIKARYEADRKRWVELKQMHREGRLDLRDPREIEASKNRQAEIQKPGVKRYNIYLVPAN